MKKLLSVFLLLVLLGSNVLAEEIDHSAEAFEENAANILNQIMNIERKIDEWALAINDTTILDQHELVKSHADVAFTAISNAITSSPLNTLPEGLEHKQEESIALIEENVLSSDWRYLEQYDVYASSDVCWSDGHIRETTTVYTESGELVGIYSIEYAERIDGQSLLVFIGYNAMYGTSTRCAVRVDDDTIETISTETFGKTLEIQLDVENWILGVEPEEWSKTLLYPKTTATE